jgi:hypothetical protein
MHLALDLDGTITAAPSTFAAMGASLIDNGHTVTVLTGALHDFPDSAKTVDGRLNQLRNLGLSHRSTSPMSTSASERVVVKWPN